MRSVTRAWLLLVPWLALLTACESDEAPPTAGDLLAEGVDYAILQMRTFVTREGVRRARVEADTAEWHGENEVHLRPMKLTFYDDGGRESTEVTSDFGILYELTEDLDARGSVVALDRVDGQRLESERLRFVSAENRLYGDTAFTLYRNEGLTVISGAAFESDPSLDSVIVITPSGQTDRPVTRTAVPVPVRATELDSVTVAGDSAQTVQASPDSSGTAELGSTQLDTTSAPLDSTSTANDTTSTPPDTTSVPPDTTATHPPNPGPVGGATPRSGRDRAGTSAPHNGPIRT